MKNEEQNYALAYFSPVTRYKFATSLIHFGISQFRRAKVISNYKKLCNLIENQNPSKGDLRTLMEIVNDQLVDFVRIIICYENYLKAFLIANEYVVHELKQTGPYADLFKDQRDRPISIFDLIQIDAFKLDREKDLFKHEGLTFKTLTISKLLSKKYQEVIQMQPKVFESLNKIKRYRNNVHFFLQEKGKVDPEFCNMLGHLIQYVEKVIVPNHDLMIEELIRIENEEIKNKSDLLKMEKIKTLSHEEE